MENQFKDQSVNQSNTQNSRKSTIAIKPLVIIAICASLFFLIAGFFCGLSFTQPGRAELQSIVTMNWLDNELGNLLHGESPAPVGEDLIAQIERLQRWCEMANQLELTDYARKNIENFASHLPTLRLQAQYAKNQPAIFTILQSELDTLMPYYDKMGDLLSYRQLPLLKEIKDPS